jgi:phosphoglycolate phosphatase-like HAD superfamily hydrolase
MRIAIDVDSTLHHYWDVLSDAARRRFGIELPYEEQFTWGITRLREEQLRCCIEETHCDQAILAGRPYADAVETVNRWHAAGHFIHITTHRPERAHAATEQWLRAIGLAFDELYCSFDKVGRCREIGIDLLIDDSPHNLHAAIEEGILAATLVHPWNEDVCETEDVIAAQHWADLAAKLEPIVSGARRPHRVA